MKITTLIAGVCLVVTHGASALDWQVRKAPVLASRTNPFQGILDPLVHASTNVENIDEFLTFKSQKTVELPLPDGTIHSFNIRPSPILSAELALKYPSIRSFQGESSSIKDFKNLTNLKNERITVVLSVSKTVNGETALYAQYVSNKRGYMFLQPQSQVGDQVNVRVSSRASAVREEPKPDFTCDTEDDTARQLMEESLVSSHMELLNDNRRKLQDAGCNVIALGNFQCDPANNRKECNFDAGDCCGGFKERFAECIPDEDPTSCLCKDPSYLTVTPRTLRLAVAANVEFSALYNSDEQAVMAQIVHTFTRVAGIFRREVGVGFEIVYTKVETDPATRVIGNSGTFAVAQQLSAIFDEAIGNDGYDIGHCLTTTPGGVAGGIGVSCNPETKAMGVTGRGDVTGDVHFVDIVAHEMGHQMGSHHMFSGCGSNAGTPGFRVEPGSGTTFMSYASICGPDNVEDRMSPYFHTLSLESMRRYQSNPAGGASCGYISEDAPVGRPNVEAQLSLSNPTVRFCEIPPSTPFRLSAMGAPINEGYFYSWEQVDNTESSGSNNLDDTSPADGALFRSIPPKQNDPSRTFPDLLRIIGATPEEFHERLPPTPRGMEFVLGVRKEYIGRDVIDTIPFILTDYGAFYVGESVMVNVSNAEPLVVTNVDVILTSGDTEGDSNNSIMTVSWTGGRIASKVRVVAADLQFGIENTDFSIVFASNVDNDGQVSIDFDVADVCTVGTGDARFLIKVESDNYLEGCSYFAVSPEPVIIDCNSVTFPPTPAPTPKSIDFEFSRLKGTFVESGVVPEDRYQSNTRYSYSLSTPVGSYIELQFLEFDVEEGWDLVNVFDGDSVDAARIATLTGIQDGRTVYSSSNKLFITLTSDCSIETRGFVARYTAVGHGSNTNAPTSSFPGEGIADHYLNASNTFGTYQIDGITKQTIVQVNSVSEGTVLNVVFNSDTFGFDGEIRLNNGNQITDIPVVSNGNPLPIYTTDNGPIEIHVIEGFPASLDFKYFTSEKPPVPDFGPVLELGVPTANGEEDMVPTLTSNVPFKFVRLAANLNTGITISFRNSLHGSICMVSKGNAQMDTDYDYSGNVVAVAIPNTFNYSLNSTTTRYPDYESYYNFINEFPQPLGSESFDILLVDNRTDRVNLYNYDYDAVTITCGGNRYNSNSIEVDTVRSRLVIPPPFTGSGLITSNGIVNYFGLLKMNVLEIASSDGKIALISLKFVRELPIGTFVYVSTTSLLDEIIGSPKYLYKFGCKKAMPVGDVIQVFADKITISLINLQSPLQAGPLPVVYSVRKIGEGNGNFTEPLPEDETEGQVNKVQLDTANPKIFKSVNHPLGTNKHAFSERWDFVAPEGYKLKITFSVFDIEEFADFVHLYNGTEVGSADRIQSFTGSYVPPAIVIENNAMVLRVVRDVYDDRPYRGVQGVVEVVREDSQWYLYVLGAMGVVTVCAVALLVKKSRSATTAAEHDEEAMAASTIEYLEHRKRRLDESEVVTANPHFDAYNI